MAALLADALARRHRVTVLAGRPSYDPAERHRPYLLHREVRGSLTVERVGSTAFSRRGMPGRLSNYLSYLALAIPRALTMHADAIVAMTDPPVAGIAGALVARMRRRRFIYNIRDLYPDMVLAGGLLGPGRCLSTWDRLHRWALRQADLVIVLGDDVRERVIAKGVDPQRVAVVRDGAPIPPALPAQDHPIVREIRSGFPFVVVHAGNLGFYGAWRTVIEAAGLLDDRDVGFVFVGDGTQRSRVEALAGRCANVRFLPFRPPEQIPCVLAAGDVHMVTVRRGLEGVVLPSKLYGVLAAGRPVLAVVPEGSDVARIVRRYDCGLVADPGSPQAVAAAVREAMTSPERLAAMGQRARGAARAFEQEKELDTFVRIVEHAVGPQPPKGGER